MSTGAAPPFTHLPHLIMKTSSITPVTGPWDVGQGALWTLSLWDGHSSHPPMSPGERESEKITYIHHSPAFRADKVKTLVCLLKNGVNWQTPHGLPVADRRLPVTDDCGFSLTICAMIDDWDTAEAFSSLTAVSQTLCLNIKHHYAVNEKPSHSVLLLFFWLYPPSSVY